MPLFAQKLFHLNHWCRALVAGLGLVCAVGLAHAQGSAQGPAMVVQQVSATAWYVEGQSALGTPANQNFISNAAFVVTPAGVVVVDALGSPALAERLLAEIRKITPQPVTHVIVTHYHADHIYGLQTFKAQGARIMAHRAARDYLNSDAALIRLQASRETLAPWINAQTRLVPADDWIEGTNDLVVGGVRFVLTPVGPSHTPEDVVVYLPQEKVLFAGDLVFRNRFFPFLKKRKRSVLVIAVWRLK